MVWYALSIFNYNYRKPDLVIYAQRVCPEIVNAQNRIPSANVKVHVTINYIYE